MDNILFQGFPKISRLSRETIVTEKIDGSNAQVFITDDNQIFVGSRTKWITPDDDNHGFAKWVEGNKQEILQLGPGRHFGEWWGSGINRGYGLIKGEKRFSLFNTIRWTLYGTTPDPIAYHTDGTVRYQDILPKCVGLVPILYKGMFDTQIINDILKELEAHGSYASEGFMNPEGIVVFHTAGNVGFKKTIHNDDFHKSLINKI